MRNDRLQDAIESDSRKDVSILTDHDHEQYILKAEIRVCGDGAISRATFDDYRNPKPAKSESTLLSRRTEWKA
jgi:hypothetical protein